MRISDWSSDVCSSDLVTVIKRDEGVWRLSTPHEDFEAPVIVNAAGALADATAELAGLAPLGLTPLRRSTAILPAPEGRDVTGWPAVCSMSETWYAKPEAGKLMVSPADEAPVEPHDDRPRSEERRGGKECGRQGRVWWSTIHKQNNTKQYKSKLKK